jgi:hypothetical protein
MHRLSYIATLGAILVAASHGIAATEPDSTASVPPSSIPVEEFTLHLERGIDRTAAYIEPRADGMVAVTTAVGRVEYIPLYRIRQIEDSRGSDRTSEVTRRGRRLGTPVPRPTPAWKLFRLRAGSPSECGSYLITDFALMWEASSPREYLYRDQEILGTVDLGYAQSLGRSHSVGGSVFLGDDGIRTHAGLRLRLYGWPAPGRSFDIAPGIVLIADNGGSSRSIAPGFSGQAGMTFSGRFGLVAQVLSVKWRGGYRSAGTDTALHVGFRLGGEPGIVGGAAFMATEVMLLGTNRSVFSPFTP